MFEVLLGMLNKRVWRLSLEINDKSLFKGFWVCKSETLGNTQSVPKKKEKLNSYSKKYVFKKNQSCIQSPRIGPGLLLVRCQSIWMTNARWSGGWMPQEVWSHLVVWIMNVRWSGYVSPSESNQAYLEVWRVCPGIGTQWGDVYIQALTQIRKVQRCKFPGQLKQK